MTAVAACRTCGTEPLEHARFTMGVAQQSATPITRAARWSNGLTP